jgi:hypothetical protein
MILSAYPTPPVVNQAKRSIRGGQIRVKCLFARQKRLSLPSCMVEDHVRCHAIKLASCLGLLLGLNMTWNLT